MERKIKEGQVWKFKCGSLAVVTQTEGPYEGSMLENNGNAFHYNSDYLQHIHAQVVAEFSNMWEALDSSIFRNK